MRGREGTVVQRRAADAWRNSALLHNVITRLRRGILGNPWPITRDDAARDAFYAWARSCGYRIQFGSLAQQLGRLSHSLAECGESYLQRIQTNGAGSSNGLLIQVWPGHLRDKGMNQFGAGTDITDGIEFSDGVPSAVWFRSQSADPSRGFISSRIPFTDLICLRYSPDPQMTGGVPYVHASIEADAQLSDLTATDLVKQRIQACLAGVVMARPGISARHLELGPRITDAEGNEINEILPGTFAIVHNAEDIRFSDPSQGGLQTEEYKAQVAAGTNMPLELIGGRLGSASYSAARYASITERETITELRTHAGIEEGLDTLIEWWKQAELLSGRDFTSVEFNWLAAPMGVVDPLKEIQANKLCMEIGVKSRSQVIFEMGRDPEAVADEIRADPIPIPLPAQQADQQEDAENGTDENDDDQAEERARPTLRLARP